MPEEQRFVLGIAYQAGPDPRIKRGVDGGRDWFSKEELERACWSYMRSGCPQINAFHVDGTEDCAEPVESFIWRWPDWDVGDGIVVKDGDWCLGAILSPRMWELHKNGKINGLSPEGTARRRRVQKEGVVAVTKGSGDFADDDDEFTELVDANVPKVALVAQGANGIPRFLISKQGEGGALFDADTVRDLIGKSEPESKLETVTMTGSPAAIAALIHGAAVRKAQASEPDPVEKAEMSAKKINDLPKIDVAKDMGPMEMDDIDLTEVLADPEVDAPGNPTTPGSPAWEAIDAATACKWTALLARARAAIDVMAEREMLEAAAGDDGDAGSAWDLQDACCAIDYAISILAPFAVGEHAEAEMGSDMLEAVGKAVAGFNPALEVIEGLAPIRKAGRVLSSANEAAIRGAVESLQKVLASLPAAPAVEDAVMKTANEEPDMPTPTLAADVTADSGQQPAMGTAEAEPKPEAGVPVTNVGKADGEKTPMVVVYDQKGKLIGIVDPADVTPVANSEADPDDMDAAADGDAAPAAEPAPADSDLTPAPAAEAGTPADAETDDVAKTDADMLKSIAHAEAEAALTAYKTAQDAERAALVKEVEELKALMKALEEQPAAPKVFTNGAVPPRDVRGMDRDSALAPVDVTKAMEMRAAFRSADPAEQNRIATQMQEAAIGQLAAIHGRG